MSAVNGLLNKGKKLVGEVSIYWKTPPLGYQIPFKEIAAYSVGGIGAYFIFTMAQQLLLSTTNVIIGNTIGIQPDHMYILYVIAVFVNIPFAGIRANIIDNTRNKAGKYRPYILRMGIPTAIMSMIFVYTPYDKIWAGGEKDTRGYIAVCVIILVYNFVLQFFYSFFYDSYENLIHVLSSNTQERANVAAVKSVVYSLAPTITTAVIPLIAAKVSEGNIYDLRVYRILYPIIAVAGIALNVVVYANTKEKIIQAKTHIIQVNFIDALRAVAKNKYFWIISLAGWLGFLEGAMGSIMQWLYNYGKVCSPGAYSILTLVYGNASFWGMLLSPFAIKKWGKRNVLIVTNLMNIVFIALVYPSRNSIWFILVFMWLNALMGSFAHILNPTIQADIRDYQHYISGERIDGMFGAVGVIGSLISLATGFVLPSVYKNYGIFRDNGYANMYDVLYNVDVLHNLIAVLIILSVVGAALNVIPYFFYDFNEDKQRSVTRILRVRAMFEDFGNNALKDRELVEVIDEINSAKKLSVLPRENLVQVRRDAKARHKAGEITKREMNKLIEQAKEKNVSITVSENIIAELNKFDTAQMQAKLSEANKVFNAGLEALADYNGTNLAEAKKLARSTKEEKTVRREAIDSARNVLRSQKLVKKYYPQGLTEYDETVFNKLFEQENVLDTSLAAMYTALSRAKDEKDSAMAAQLNEEIKQSRLSKKKLSAEIKKATKENSVYHRCAKPYLDAHRLILEERNFRRFDEIAAMYDLAKERAEESERLEKEAQEQKEAEKAAFEARLKAEKAMKKQKKNNKK